MKSQKTNAAHRFARAALCALGHTGWAQLDLETLAGQAGLSLASAHKIAATKDDLIPLILAFIDEETEERAGKATGNEPLQDRMFDVFMCRFESLQPYRDGVLALADAARKTPDIALGMYKGQLASMRRMLTLIDPRNKPSRQERLKPHILVILYNRAFLTWSRDQTPDLSSTMDCLNKLFSTAWVLSIVQRT